MRRINIIDKKKREKNILKNFLKVFAKKGFIFFNINCKSFT